MFVRINYLKYHVFLPLVFLIFSFHCMDISAGEGLWVPVLLNKYNIEEMQQKGFKLSAEDIYSINHASLKDAVPIFGHGCTGAVVSAQGLLLTNYHCGDGQIKSLDNGLHHYLAEGFWAYSKDQELPCPGLSVTFLVRMEEVTKQVLSFVNDQMNEEKRSAIIHTVCNQLEKEAVRGTSYKAEIKPLFKGNNYYLYITEEYKDIRLVGAPPVSIGKFGGDKDNWVWPRHNADFALFRIYAGKNNQPASYSPENIPFRPAKYFPISLNGVRENDFTMVMGYPGYTDEYLPSAALKQLMEIDNPSKILIRQTKLDVLNAALLKNPQLKVKYADKISNLLNYWKKWSGEVYGVRKMNVMASKGEDEKQFTSWVQADSIRNNRYGHILNDYQKYYNELKPYVLAGDYFYENTYTLDLVNFATMFKPFFSLTERSPKDQVDKAVTNLLVNYKTFYKNYDKETDKQLFIKAVTLFRSKVNYGFWPSAFNKIDKQFGGSVKKYVNYLYSTSYLPDSNRLVDFLHTFSVKRLKQFYHDPAIEFYFSLVNLAFQKIYPALDSINLKIDHLNRIYLDALKQMKGDQKLYPDANFTLRLSYGQVRGYKVADAVSYNYFTTLKGMLEKQNDNPAENQIPEKLKSLYMTKDFYPYADKDTMKLCFLADNQTSGGSSGSPVLNGEGQLVGLNFDRNWEGTMGDLSFNPDICRNISVDIRYILFIIDKYAGAKNLISEMDIHSR